MKTALILAAALLTTTVARAAAFNCIGWTNADEEKIQGLKLSNYEPITGIVHVTECGLEMPMAPGVVDYCNVGSFTLTVRPPAKASTIEIPGAIGGRTMISLRCEPAGRESRIQQRR